MSRRFYMDTILPPRVSRLHICDFGTPTPVSSWSIFARRSLPYPPKKHWIILMFPSRKRHTVGAFLSIQGRVRYRYNSNPTIFIVLKQDVFLRYRNKDLEKNLEVIPRPNHQASQWIDTVITSGSHWCNGSTYWIYAFSDWMCSNNAVWVRILNGESLL